ncbi:DUF1127 domain-containing protein [Tropicimonas marinistellae]|uniref:DUF1127 domain-containing protein n=1 Tax=Tropicimonas marinistellae TaxID=1739787 RepID=UPI000835CB12|nr:DUF1127 domain-containing protein [Tropicimonas marinistellae]
MQLVSQATTPTVQAGATRASDIVTSVGVFLRRTAVYRRTLRELKALSDRELDDLDLRRSDLAAIARGVAAKA